MDEAVDQKKHYEAGVIVREEADQDYDGRFGFDSYETEERYDALKLTKLADTIRPF